MVRTKICHLLHSLQVGGAEMLAATLGRRFAREYCVNFVCLDELGTMGQELRRDGFKVDVIGRRSGVDWKCAMQLGAILRRERVDLIHAHQYTPFFYALAARCLHRRPPILFHEHGRHQPDYPRRKRRIVNRLLLEKRDRVVGVGEAVKQALIVNEGIPADRIGVIYNGIDPTRFQDHRHDRVTIRKEIGIGADALMVLQVARLDYLKDHATGLRAFKRVASLLPQARLVLVGEGPERRFIEDEVANNHLTDKVRLLGSRTDVARLLAASDIFLLTSISEGIPLTLMEAMAASLPVVATEVGGVAEVVTHAENGLLAPAREDEALADHLVNLGQDPALRNRLGQAGRQRVLAKFAEEQMQAAYQRLYEGMCHG